MRFYEDLTRIKENRLPQRSYYIPEGAAKYLSLNGEWDFKYYDCDYKEEKEITKWDKIPVPSCWQLFGYEDPNYTNVFYPYPVDPPSCPTIIPSAFTAVILRSRTQKSAIISFLRAWRPTYRSISTAHTSATARATICRRNSTLRPL